MFVIFRTFIIYVKEYIYPLLECGILFLIYLELRKLNQK